MTFRSCPAAIFILVLTSTTALSAPTTPEEASRLTGVFQAYLGQAPGVVTVTPADEHYEVKIDFAPLFAQMAQPGLSLEISPTVMKLADQGGGKWLVTQDSAFSFRGKMAGALDFSMTAGKLSSTGIFDEALGTFASSSTDIADLSFDETFIAPVNGQTHVSYVIKAAHYETAMTAGADGGADGTFHSEMTGLAERFGIPLDPLTPPIDINVTIGKATQAGTVQGLRTKPILNLLSWFVAHPSSGEIVANQVDLKKLLHAGLPLLGNIAVKSSFDTLSVTTPAGPVEIANAGLDFSMNGIVAEGLLHYKLALSGLKLPAGLVPTWAVDLVPNAMTLDFNMADFNLAAPVGIMLDNLDLAATAPPKPELEQQLMQALLPKGTVTLSMGPSKIISKILDLGFEGSMTAGALAIPAGQATMSAKGIDQLMEAVNAAPPEMGLSDLMKALIAAKGLSKQDAGGGLTWKIESTPTGGVLINGIDPLKM
ncbi:MAG: hypothetical protein H7X89_03160 [Rhizobiales bacterium]|nr:hypothetical protein [Hyphomicrobiales bacterium]